MENSLTGKTRRGLNENRGCRKPVATTHLLAGIAAVQSAPWANCGSTCEDHEKVHLVVVTGKPVRDYCITDNSAIGIFQSKAERTKALFHPVGAYRRGSIW